MRGRNEHVLYLDYDGVLHPDDVYRSYKHGILLRGVDNHHLFEHVSVLEELLAPWPDLKVVLSTSWVREAGFDEARGRLSAPLQERVIGATHHSIFKRDPEMAAWWGVAHRYEQILADVARRGPSAWLALDNDGEGWHDQDRARLVLCDDKEGLGGAATQEALIRSLSELYGDTLFTDRRASVSGFLRRTIFHPWG